MDANNEINLRSLKRFDSSVDQILSSATQVAVYNFSNGEWNKLDVEGALFVVSKKGANSHGLIIMNRLSTNNFNEIVDSQWDVTLNLPFLLYKNDKGNIRCVWFYSTVDCNKVYEKLHAITTGGCAAAGTQQQQAPKNGLDFSKLFASAAGNSAGNTTSGSKPVEETLAKLGIKSQTTKNNNTDQFMRSLIQQTNQKLSIVTNSNEGRRKIELCFCPVLDRFYSGISNEVFRIFDQTNLTLSIRTKDNPSPPNEKALPNLPATPGTLSRTLNVQELFNSTSKPSVIANLTNSFASKLAADITPIKSKAPIESDADLVLTPALLKQNGSTAKSIGEDPRALSPPILSSQPQEQLYRPTPTQFNHSTNEFSSPFQATRPFGQQPNTLTMEQLKQTLIYLLQNDADFLHSIHSTYKQSVQSKFY